MVILAIKLCYICVCHNCKTCVEAFLGSVGREPLPVDVGNYIVSSLAGGELQTKMHGALEEQVNDLMGCIDDEECPTMLPALLDPSTLPP